jgi:hypothetical protein
MRLERFIELLDGVRSRSRGYLARCPAHADRTPSLSIRAGEDDKILLKCFAGCEAEDICRSLGLTLADLFPSLHAPRHKRIAKQRIHRPLHWRTLAARLEDHAMSRWLRSESVLKAATNLDITEWTDDDRDVAMNAVANAQHDQTWSAVLEDAAFMVRSRGLAEENKNERHSDAS